MNDKTELEKLKALKTEISLGVKLIFEV